MNSKYAWSGVLVGIAVMVLPALAHHSLQAEYDIQKSLTLTGVITRVDWVNPHVYLYMDVKDAGGKVASWALSSLPPATLKRGGLTKDKLGAGQTVTVLAYHAKDSSNLAFLRTITFADGHKIEIWLGDVNKAP